MTVPIPPPPATPATENAHAYVAADATGPTLPAPAGDLQVPAATRPAAGPNWIAAGVAGVVVGVLATLAVQGIARQDGGSPALEQAMETCKLDNTTGIDLRDGGESIVFDSKGEEDSTGASIVDIACVLGALEVPSSVTSHMDQTTSMDGRQTATWDDITVSWSYHPDRGLDGVITLG